MFLSQLIEPDRKSITLTDNNRENSTAEINLLMLLMLRDEGILIKDISADKQAHTDPVW